MRVNCSRTSNRNSSCGTGNGGPYNQADRSPCGGDNLYRSSIVAPDPKTDLPKWHDQQTHGDNWDFTATQPMVLTRLEMDDQRRPMPLHAPKNGYRYALDRRIGELLRANWAKSIDLNTGQPELDPAADYSQSPKIVLPSVPSARNWQPMAWHPGTAPGCCTCRCRRWAT